MATILRAGDGEAYDSPEFWMDRFLLDGTRADGRLSVVEHTLAPRVLAAPVHIHTRKDEYSLVLGGTLGVLLGEEEVFAGPGDFVSKPRGQWHTFWNAGDSTLRIMEIITPAGLEELFKVLGRAGEGCDPAELPALAASYGCDVDLDRTTALVDRLGLRF